MSINPLIRLDNLIKLKEILSEPENPVFIALDSEFMEMSAAMGSLLTKIDSADGITRFTVNHINYGGIVQ